MVSSGLRGEPFVEVTRGDVVESVHEILACLMDRSGVVVAAMGDIEAPVFLRSTSKPFIAAAAIAAGARERFGLEPQEIAVMAASHSGQPFHVNAVRSILAKIGMDESALQCGAHAPYNLAAAQDLERLGVVPSAIHNNCSGKHAGILALCASVGADPGTYLDVDNPAEATILALCARLSGVAFSDLILGIDGCGIPVYAVSLRDAARSFARFASLEGVADADAAALTVVRDAMIAFPEYVSGTGEFDAVLMRVGAGRIACKAGAEGVHGTAVLDKGMGLVVKVADGAARGRAPAVCEILRGAGLLDAADSPELQAFARPSVYNRAGRPVGEVRPAYAFAIS